MSMRDLTVTEMKMDFTQNSFPFHSAEFRSSKWITWLQHTIDIDVYICTIHVINFPKCFKMRTKILVTFIVTAQVQNDKFISIYLIFQRHQHQ